MDRRFIRTQMLLGEAAMQKLQTKKVAVFGLGGVGGYVCEALVRSGIGRFVLVDNDTISLSNLNRQIIALNTTVGQLKTEAMKERMLQINAHAQIKCLNHFFLPGKDDMIDSDCDFLVDAIDTVTAKIELAIQAQARGIPLISCMGTGNKLDPTQLAVADIYQTSVCPLAKVMRYELKKRGVRALKVVYSKEIPRVPLLEEDALQEAGERTKSHRTPASAPFVPPAAGLIIASEVIRYFTEGNSNG